MNFDRPVFLAPMAGITNLPFRIITRRYGCQLAFTEMVSVNGLVRGSDRTCRYLDSAPQDHPLGVQIFGADPEIMAAGARIVADGGADLIDINMGCPVKKVVRSGAGAALLRDPAKAGRIVSAVRRVTSLPLTVKIRSGWRQSAINAPALAKILEEEGADAVIVHPRAADQGFSGAADWSVIRAVKDVLRIPVIGNGDIRHAGDVRRMMTATACDGVMIGRAALGNPWIFKDIMAQWPVWWETGNGGEREIAADGCGAVRTALPSAPAQPACRRTGADQGEGQGITGRGDDQRLPEPSVIWEERERVIREHLALETDYAGEYAGVQGFRKHILWYTKGMRNSAALRQQLGAFRRGDVMLAALQAYFAAANNGLDFS